MVTEVLLSLGSEAGVAGSGISKHRDHDGEDGKTSSSPTALLGLLQKDTTYCFCMISFRKKSLVISHRKSTQPDVQSLLRIQRRCQSTDLLDEGREVHRGSG